MDNYIIFLTSVMAAIIGGLVWGRFHRGNHQIQGTAEAEKVKENKQDEIKATPAPDLVAADPAADELHADAAGIAGRAKQRLRDRVGKIVSGYYDSGPAGGGGSGD